MRDAVVFHNGLAYGWDERYGRGGFGRRARFFNEVILPLLPSKGRWLDAGCGSGTFSRVLAQAGRGVIGVDASAAMVSEARKRTKASAPSTLFQEIETIEKLPFVANSFDGVICLSVLEYLEQPNEALLELLRVIKPGGALAFSVPDNRSFIRKLQKVYRRLGSRRSEQRTGYLAVSRFSTVPKEMCQILGAQDVTVRTVRSFDAILPRWLHWLLKPSLIYIVCEKDHREVVQ